MKLAAKIWILLYVIVGTIVLSYIATPALADPLKSSHFQFQETSLGGTGFSNAQSANFQATGSGAILGIGNSASSDFQINAGNETTNDPALTFAVTSPNVSFGSFSAGTAATATSTFQVSDYTSYGYIVQMVGNPPAYGSHMLPGMSAAGPSQVGTEQFGINLVANTSPVSLGANPDHGQFGVGAAAPNYDTPNNYRYVSGETIASAPKSSGITTYTISYIVNVTSVSPSGEYTGSQTLICTGTY